MELHDNQCPMWGDASRGSHNLRSCTCEVKPEDLNLLQERMIEAGFTKEQAVLIMEIVAGVCYYCWNSDRSSCTCMRDD